MTKSRIINIREMQKMQINRPTHAVIIGAGLSGLSCALHLKKAGIEYTILEASNSVGGRVQSDILDGFILDRGFQVLLSAYPEAREILEYEKLDLKTFIPGAMVRLNDEFHVVSDPWRRPADCLKTVFSPIGTFKDKLLIDKLRRTVTEGSLKSLYAHKEMSSVQYLENFGFSEQMIDRFFRPFFGGVFFDKTLSTSSKMLEFTFRMFSTGDTCIPAHGMGEISKQLAEKVGLRRIQLNSRVSEIRENSIILEDGTLIQTDAIVVATEGPEASRLLGKSMVQKMRSVRCLYFAADKAPLAEPILVLNGQGSSVINNLCIPSNVSEAYAPKGKSLISVSVIGRNELGTEDLQKLVVDQLADWFGSDARTWRHLRTYDIKQGLPDYSFPSMTEVEQSTRLETGWYVCGDHRDTASIQGALSSGKRAAHAIVEDFASVSTAVC